MSPDTCFRPCLLFCFWRSPTLGGTHPHREGRRFPLGGSALRTPFVSQVSTPLSTGMGNRTEHKVPGFHQPLPGSVLAMHLGSDHNPRLDAAVQGSPGGHRCPHPDNALTGAGELVGFGIPCVWSVQQGCNHTSVEQGGTQAGQVCKHPMERKSNMAA